MRISTSKNSMGGMAYVTPSVEVLDVISEGVFCISNDSADYGYDNDNDLGEI